MITQGVLCYCRKEAQQILELAKTMDLTGKEYVWIVSQSIVGNIEGQWKAAPDEFPIGLFGRSHSSPHILEMHRPFSFFSQYTWNA